MIAPTITPGSLAELLEQYQLARDITSRTVDQHRYARTSFEKFLGRTAMLTDFTPDTMNRFLVWLQSSPLQANTIKSRRRALLTLWRFAFDEAIIEVQPVRVRKITGTHSMPVAWTLDEVRLLLTTAAGWKGRLHCHPVERPKFWQAFITTGVYSGLRLGDLLLLEFKHIDASGWLSIVQHKTGFPIRCYLPDDAREAIAAIKAPKRARIFGDLMSRKCIQENYQKLVKRAGLVGSAKTMRRTAATMAECLQPGAASWLLGHRDATLARRHYIDAGQVMATAPAMPTLRI